MKPYEKPRLVALSLAGNERLCADCSSDPAKLWDSDSMDLFLEMVGLNENAAYLDGVTKTEFENIFSGVDDCVVVTGTDWYCKFTGAQNVAWS